MFSLSPPPQRKCRVAALTSVFVIVVTGLNLVAAFSQLVWHQYLHVMVQFSHVQPDLPHPHNST